MKVELIKGSHSIGESNLHLQFTPAYRQDIFCDKAVSIITRDYLLASARMHGFEILAIGFGFEHIHIFVSGWKNFSIAKLVQLMKGFSSRMMRKFHKNLFENKLYGKKFWSAGYFYRTVGVVNAATVKKYVEQSQEYGFAERELKGQRKIIEFSS